MLQEALLMGYGAYGTDLSEKMIEYSTGNLHWLNDEYGSLGRHPEPVEGSRSFDSAQGDKLQWKIEQGDATTHQWDSSKIQDLSSKICVATETYLGTPLSSLPEHAKLVKIMNEANDIAEAFLKNISSQIKSGTRLCVALPAWYAPNAPSIRSDSPFLHLKMLDQLSDLGYNRLEFVHARTSELIYHREDQIVARELTILEKN